MHLCCMNSNRSMILNSALGCLRRFHLIHRLFDLWRVTFSFFSFSFHLTISSVNAYGNAFYVSLPCAFTDATIFFRFDARSWIGINVSCQMPCLPLKQRGHVFYGTYSLSMCFVFNQNDAVVDYWNHQLWRLKCIKSNQPWRKLCGAMEVYPVSLYEEQLIFINLLIRPVFFWEFLWDMNVCTQTELIWVLQHLQDFVFAQENVFDANTALSNW